MVPRSLAFGRNEAGKPALHWEGVAAMEGPGARLQFNISHTSSLLGERKLCRNSSVSLSAVQPSLRLEY